VTFYTLNALFSTSYNLKVGILAGESRDLFVKLQSSTLQLAVIGRRLLCAHDYWHHFRIFHIFLWKN